MENIKLLFGRKIKELRKKHGYTQAKLAELVFVDDKHISCIESGKNFPSSDLIARLASALLVEPKDLFEFYHLDNPENLKKGIISMLSSLDEKELAFVYKFIRNFLI